MNTETNTPAESTESILARMAAATEDDTTSTHMPEDWEPDFADEADQDYYEWLAEGRARGQEYDLEDGDYADAVEALAEPLPVLDPEHIEFLALERIDAAVAVQHGTRTVRHRADLPGSLRSVWDGKGILFMHTRMDGTTVPQYRPDVPSIKGKSGKVTKYWFPKGAGSSPYVSPLQKSLVGRSRRTWIIEGTKAFLAIVSMLVATGQANNILAVCFPGCTAARKEGVYDDALADLIPAGSIATVFFDADVATNPNVNRMGAELQSHIEVVCLSEARFAKTTASAKAGVSDWIGGMKRRSDQEVMNILLGVEAKALKKLPRVAAAARKTVRSADATTTTAGYKVQWLDECISKPFTDDSGKEHLGEVILRGAAIRLKAAYEVYDDLSETAVRMPMFDLELKSGGKVYDLEKIPKDALTDPRELLSRLPGSVGETMSVTPRMGEHIGEAIRVSAGRAGAELPVKRMLTRSGWYLREETAEDGTTKEVARYVAMNGAIGPDNFVTDLSGRIEEPSFAKFNVVDPHGFTQEEHAEAVRDTLAVGDNLLVDPALWITCHGFIAITAAGVTNVGAGVAVGEPGSGKSYMLQGLSTMQVPVWADLANFEGTKNYVADMGKGAEHATQFADDIRFRGIDSKAATEQNEAFEMIMRRAYEGGSRSRGRKIQNMLSKQFEQGEKMTNSPCFILSAENAALPDGVDSTGATNSSMTRGLFIQVTHASTFKRGAADEFRELAESGTFHLAHMGYIADLAKSKALNGHDREVEAIKGVAKGWKAELGNLYPGLPSRSYEIAANALTGYIMFLDYAHTIGAIDMTEYNRRHQGAVEIIARVMQDSYANFQGGSKETTPLGRIVSAVLAGGYHIDGLGELTNPNSRRLGKVGEADGVPVVHIFTAEAQKITGMKPKALGMSLKADLHPNAHQPFTRKVSFDGGTGIVPCYSISREAWSGSGWEAEEAANEAAKQY